MRTFLSAHIGVRLLITLNLLLVLLAFSTFMRIVFFVRFRETGHTQAVAQVSKAFYRGFKFDLRIALLVIVPFLLCSWMPGLHAHLWSGVYSLVFTGLFIGYVLDLGHFAYLQSRVNATVLTNGVSFLQTKQ